MVIFRISMFYSKKETHSYHVNGGQNGFITNEEELLTTEARCCKHFDSLRIYLGLISPKHASHYSFSVTSSHKMKTNFCI